jgi:hypothetical protein
MKTINLTFLICFLFIASTINAQKTTIFFKQKTYSNDSVEVFCLADYITENRKQLAFEKVNDTGYFECSFTIKNPTQVFLPLGIFQVSVYVEPGKIYHLLVPPKKKLDVSDELNPFFTPVNILAGIKESDSTELNSLIRNFDDVYDIFLSKNFNNIYYSAKKSIPDSAIAVMKKRFEWTKNPFFQTYMEYKINLIRYMAYERDNNYVIKYHFNNFKVSFSNPAYMSMFNDIFKHYFSVSVSKNWGGKILDDIAKSKSPWELHQTLKNNPALSNDTLIDLIILKGLHDAFYADKIAEYRSFPKKQLLMTLDSMTCCAMTPEFKEIAKNIKEKVIEMMPGTDAPSFSLLNLDSVPISLSELRGKYLYINFFDFRSYSFLNEISLLKNISNKFSKDLDVVTIICNGSITQAKDLCAKNDYKWYFLVPPNSKQILLKYHVKAMPTYYLIDPYGKIIMSPATGPDGNFESTFSSILRDRN